MVLLTALNLLAVLLARSHWESQETSALGIHTWAVADRAASRLRRSLSSKRISTTASLDCLPAPLREAVLFKSTRDSGQTQ